MNWHVAISPMQSGGGHVEKTEEDAHGSQPFTDVSRKLHLQALVTHPHEVLATDSCFWLLSNASDIKGNVGNT